MYVLYGCMCMYKSKQAPRPNKERKSNVQTNISSTLINNTQHYSLRPPVDPHRKPH
jgi:hypothetical protein